MTEDDKSLDQGGDVSYENKQSGYILVVKLIEFASGLTVWGIEKDVTSNDA